MVPEEFAANLLEYNCIPQFEKKKNKQASKNTSEEFRGYAAKMQSAISSHPPQVACEQSFVAVWLSSDVCEMEKGNKRRKKGLQSQHLL